MTIVIIVAVIAYLANIRGAKTVRFIRHVAPVRPEPPTRWKRPIDRAETLPPSCPPRPVAPPPRAADCIKPAPVSRPVGTKVPLAFRWPAGDRRTPLDRMSGARRIVPGLSRECQTLSRGALFAQWARGAGQDGTAPRESVTSPGPRRPALDERRGALAHGVLSAGHRAALVRTADSSRHSAGPKMASLSEPSASVKTSAHDRPGRASARIRTARPPDVRGAAEARGGGTALRLNVLYTASTSWSSAA